MLSQNKTPKHQKDQQLILIIKGWMILVIKGRMMVLETFLDVKLALLHSEVDRSWHCCIELIPPVETLKQLESEQNLHHTVETEEQSEKRTLQ
jgi:hypothetical protein